jgi:pyruvate formate lyase activating enzyme
VLQGRIARISRSAVHDGPGVRTVVFLKGCPLRCLWCHSPETQALAADILLLRDRCLHCGACVDACEHGAASLDREGPVIERGRCERCGRCTEVCPGGARELQGAWMDETAVLEAIRRDVPFYDVSGGGVTFSGGEPLLQPEFLAAMIRRCRAEGINTAVETCGHASRAAARLVLYERPLFLFDIKLVDDRRHREATGVSNLRILWNFREFAAAGADIVVRFPLVPGINDDDESVTAVAALVAREGVRRIDVLPYHRAGVAKYERLDRSYPLEGTPVPAAEDVESAAALMREFGLDVRIGGAS